MERDGNAPRRTQPRSNPRRNSVAVDSLPPFPALPGRRIRRARSERDQLLAGERLAVESLVALQIPPERPISPLRQLLPALRILPGSQITGLRSALPRFGPIPGFYRHSAGTGHHGHLLHSCVRERFSRSRLLLQDEFSVIQVDGLPAMGVLISDGGRRVVGPLPFEDDVDAEGNDYLRVTDARSGLDWSFGLERTVNNGICITGMDLPFFVRAFNLHVGDVLRLYDYPNNQQHYLVEVAAAAAE